MSQAHTNYAGGYDLTHPTISAFWQVVTGLSEDQKRALLKFVTSCSRPPLLGFKVSVLMLIYSSMMTFVFRIWILPSAFKTQGRIQKDYQRPQLA